MSKSSSESNFLFKGFADPPAALGFGPGLAFSPPAAAIFLGPLGALAGLSSPSSVLVALALLGTKKS